MGYFAFLNNKAFQTNSPQRGWKLEVHSFCPPHIFSFQTNSPQRGWKRPSIIPSILFMLSFPNQLPSAGMETFLFLSELKTTFQPLSKPTPLNGDGNPLYPPKKDTLQSSFQTNSPQRGWKLYLITCH